MLCAPLRKPLEDLISELEKIVDAIACLFFKIKIATTTLRGSRIRCASQKGLISTALYHFILPTLTGRRMNFTANEHFDQTINTDRYYRSYDR